MGSGITLTNIETKVIRSLENRGILLKGTTKKIIGQKGGYLGNLLGLLMKVSLSLLKNVLTLLAKSVLLPFGLTAVTDATDAAIQKNIYGSGMTTLIISNKEMKDIMNIVKYLEESGLLIKVVSETIENEAKE